MRINTACRKSAWLSCLLAAAPAAGQETTQAIVIGQTTTIESQILDETRAISIGTPQFYGDGGDDYGVLYVLDAETNFRQAAGTTQFLAGPFTQTIPPLLVVGIGSTDRMRDLTPPSQVQQEIDVYPTQGGADRFLRFILEELEPWVDAHYRTNGYRALLGHSLSGLFALHALVTQPEAFNAYIVLDPSLWWNDSALLRQTEAFLGSRRGIDASLFLAVSSDDGPEYDTMRGLVERLEAKAPNGLRWQLTPIVSESHETLPLPGTYQGLRWLFSDWDIEDQASALFSEAPAEQILSAIDALYRRNGDALGFERDTPYAVFESLLNYLAGNDRLDEAAALSLHEADRFAPLPNVVSGIAALYATNGKRDAAIAYLEGVLDVSPDNEAAVRALADMRVDESAR